MLWNDWSREFNSSEYCSPTFTSQTGHADTRTKKRKVHTLDRFDKGVFKRSISTMYGHQNLLPTLDNIRRTLEENIDYRGSKSHLHKELKEIGFEYKRCGSNRKLLMERPDVVFARVDFLRKVKQYRDDGHNIIYTDETCSQSPHCPQVLATQRPWP